MTELKTPHRDEMDARFATVKAALDDVQEAASQAVREHSHQIDALRAEREAALEALAICGHKADTLLEALRGLVDEVNMHREARANAEGDTQAIREDAMRHAVALHEVTGMSADEVVAASLGLRTDRIAAEGVGDTEPVKARTASCSSCGREARVEDPRNGAMRCEDYPDCNAFGGAE